MASLTLTDLEIVKEIPGKNVSGYCQCGCGQKAPLATRTQRGYKVGEPVRFVRGHSSRKLGPDIEIVGGCWIWRKSVDPHGYGRIWVSEQRHALAHRVYYERHRGPLSSERELHHLCGNRLCVNPDHLQCVTRREHMLLDGRIK